MTNSTERTKIIYEISQLVNLFEAVTAHLCGVGDLPYHLSYLETEELVLIRARMFRFIKIIRDPGSPESIVDGLTAFVRDQIVAIDSSIIYKAVE